MLEIGTFQRRDHPNNPYHQHGDNPDSQYAYEPQPAYIDEYPSRPSDGTATPRPVGQSTTYGRPNSSLYADDYASPGWPPSIAGRSESHTLVDSAAGSRASVRSWKTGAQTPVDSSVSPRYGMPLNPDSGPGTPMVCNKCSLLPPSLDGTPSDRISICLCVSPAPPSKKNKFSSVHNAKRNMNKEPESHQPDWPPEQSPTACRRQRLGRQ